MESNQSREKKGSLGEDKLIRVEYILDWTTGSHHST